MAAGPVYHSQMPGPLDDELRQRERQVIVEALKQNDGHIVNTATALGLSLRQLHRKLLAMDLRGLADALRRAKRETT